MREPVGAWMATCVLLLGVVACEGDTDSDEVDDPRHVSAEELRETDQWELSFPSAISIGVVEGPEVERFAHVSDAMLRGSEIFVLDQGSSTVRVFNDQGEHLRSFGRKGDGPGEFGRPLTLTFLGDSVAVWDVGLRRLSIFAQPDSFLRSLRVTESLQSPQLVTVFEDRSFVLSDARVSLPRGDHGSAEGSLVVLHFSPAGALLDTLGVFSAGVMTQWSETGFGPQPFGSRAWVSGGNRSVWVAPGDMPQILEIGPGGDTLSVIQWEEAPREVTGAHLDSYFESGLESVSDQRLKRRILEQREAGMVASHLPVADRIMLDRAGRIWVRQYAAPDAREVQRWRIFDREGPIEAEVLIPDGMRLHDADLDRILVVARDSLNVDYIQVFDVE